MRNKSWVSYVLFILVFINDGFTAIMKTADNRIISYTDAGHGTPLVLIHAFPTDKNLWDYQKELKKYFRIITLDLWGFGQSSYVDGNAITMAEYADEVYQLLEHLHIDKAILGGESMGGYVALSFLHQYPDKINGLILSNTQSIADTEEVKIKRESSAIEVLNDGPSQFIDTFMTRALPTTAPQKTKDHLLNILHKQSAHAIASGLRGMALRTDTSEVLANTQLPILIITGDLDMVINKQQSFNMHTLAKNSTLITIKNTGHLSNIEQPEHWNKAVIKQFKKT